MVTSEKQSASEGDPGAGIVAPLERALESQGVGRWKSAEPRPCCDRWMRSPGGGMSKMLAGAGSARDDLISTSYVERWGNRRVRPISPRGQPTGGSRRRMFSTVGRRPLRAQIGRSAEAGRFWKADIRLAVALRPSWVGHHGWEGDHLPATARCNRAIAPGKPRTLRIRPVASYSSESTRALS